MTAKNSKNTSIKVLCVCLGNICRSPAAQGVLESDARRRALMMQVDSAGTAAYHLGKSPDPRSIAALSKHQIDISGQQARQVQLTDFDEYDWILAMDKSNLNNLMKICPSNLQSKLVLFSQFSGGDEDVKDPYYGADEGFDKMFEHLKSLSEFFLDHIESQRL